MLLIICKAVFLLLTSSLYLNLLCSCGSSFILYTDLNQYCNSNTKKTAKKNCDRTDSAKFGLYMLRAYSGSLNRTNAITIHYKDF
jgi:hypothetical protein